MLTSRAFLAQALASLCCLAAATTAIVGLGPFAAALALAGAGFSLWAAAASRRDSVASAMAAEESGARLSETEARAGRLSVALSAAEAEFGLAATLRATEGGACREAAANIGEAGLRLPFARRIIEAVPRKTEEATFALIERFEAVHAVSTQAAAAAEKARGSLASSSERGSIESTARKSREAVRAERLAVAGVSAQGKETAKRLKTMSRELESGLDLLKGIEEISERSRLIAFNMAVEAARAGEKGRGFRVIVVELQSLNDKTADFSRQIARLLIHFKEDNSALVSDMAGRTELLVGEAEKGMSAAEEAVESLIGAAGDTEAFARRISELALSIDKDLDKVLESLQFQDISRQMLEGALEILREIGENVEAAKSRLGAGGTGAASTLAASTLAENRERLERLKRELSARSKTQDERDAISEVTL